MYTAELIASLFPDGEHILIDPSATIQNICIDSRKASWQPEALFIAMQGARTDGHVYIKDAWDQGVRSFLVHNSVDTSTLPNANYIRVPNVLKAFHEIAAYHRSQYKGKVIAIIGSNGKTWVKEWLYMLMYRTNSVYRSPGSFNSQVGVPLSVWNIPTDSSYAIIEAGISKPGEMEQLEKIIKPDLVIFTHLGDAHDEGFGGDVELKLKEKLMMSKYASTIVFSEDQLVVAKAIKALPDKKLFSWSLHDKGVLNATANRSDETSHVEVKVDGKSFSYQLPFIGGIPVANSLSSITALVALDIPVEGLLSTFEELQPIDMRLKAEDAIQNCVLINDSYSLDLESLQFALESLDIAGQSQKKTLILSDHAYGRPGIYDDLAKMISGAGIDKLICVGNEVKSLIDLVDQSIVCRSYKDVDDLFRKGGLSDLYNEVILLKGARKFGFERIARRLRLRSHSAVLHVDFQALDHNLRYFYKLLKPGVKKIAVVKANAYGAGSLEVCRFLSYQHVDMLAVAVIDEGIELRESGITMPVIVLNPDPEGMDLIIQHNLEPEIYNQHILLKLLKQCNYSQSPAVVHIKLDSGTHRLGFGKNDIDTLISTLQNQHWIRVGTIFSHLSGSDDPKWDSFTHEQVHRFDEMYQRLAEGIGYRPARHILSTTGILRFSEYQYEGVRMGIGLYGVGLPQHPDLMPVHSLKARILHIQQIEPGESVSYGRSFITDTRRTIATVNLGYADGLPRVAGNVGCSFLLRGRMAPIIGRVCMDMTMVDVSHIPEAQIGDEITVFDKEHSIELLAKACGTIPYEIMTNLNPRIRKVYEHG
ncbi:MAG TPA: bifunctional UDP-N-acetylmuramoyl-tripeptide:D-alanyl-D-alanine ligase/alanine racemase [Saprospiraceae bacterium]|nr:bifunctional UDP-N-acetylmuramoyl-tripeptide:D-alanyl-D-alanine ligase/alanine racemase [Saprospiraceae bacterium]